MIIKYWKGIPSMDRRDFRIDGVDFLITGTEIDPYGNYICCVKNIEAKKTNEIEHDRLCRIILKDQEDNKELIVDIDTNEDKFTQGHLLY